MCKAILRWLAFCFFLCIYFTNSTTVYDINLSDLSNSNSYQAAIVAGLWNKKVRQQTDYDIGKYDTIHLNRNPEDPSWLETALYYYTEMTSSSPPMVVESSLDTIIKLAINQSLIRNRILYDITESYSIPPLIMLCIEYAGLPILNESEYNNYNLPIIYNTISKFSNEYSATLFSFNRYLNTTNSSIKLNQTIMVLQKPDELLSGFLTDWIVSDNLFIIWMDNLCLLESEENILFKDIVSSLYYTTNQSIGLSIMGYYPSDEVLCTCTKTHSQISLTSDFVISLSFHQLLPSILSYIPYKYLIQIPYRQNISYNSSKIYLALIQSDGDNIQLDMNGLRPRMEERISLCSATNRSNNICPIFGWTISNRLLSFAPHIIYWFYNMSLSITNVDSFLMGPSGYGYLYPSVIKPENLQNNFIQNTILDGYLSGKMQGFVYWDYESTPNQMNKYLLKFDNYNYTSINNGIINDTNFKFNGIFSDSPFLDSYIGDEIVTFALSHSWNSAQSPQHVAQTLNRNLQTGSLTYLYKIWDVTFNEVEEMVSLLNDNIVLVDYREMIVLANDKREKQNRNAYENP